MNMYDPFDPMSPFFQDEFIFNEDDELRRRQEKKILCRQDCPHCGHSLIFPEGAMTVRCNHCGDKFAILD